MSKESFQPKDTGKLTNFHYATEEDRREEEVRTEHGTLNIDNVVEEEK